MKMTVAEIRKEVFSCDHGLFEVMGYHIVREIFESLEKQLATREDRLQSQLTKTKERITELGKEIAQLRNPSICMDCEKRVSDINETLRTRIDAARVEYEHTDCRGELYAQRVNKILKTARKEGG